METLEKTPEKKALRLIKIGEAFSPTNSSIRPITQLIQFPVKTTDRYEDLFIKLEDFLRGNSSAGQAAQEWIKSVDAHDIRKDPVMEYEPADNIQYYAIFDLYSVT